MQLCAGGRLLRAAAHSRVRGAAAARSYHEKVKPSFRSELRLAPLLTSPQKGKERDREGGGGGRVAFAVFRAHGKLAAGCDPRGFLTVVDGVVSGGFWAAVHEGCGPL